MRRAATEACLRAAVSLLLASVEDMHNMIKEVPVTGHERFLIPSAAGRCSLIQDSVWASAAVSPGRR